MVAPRQFSGLLAVGILCLLGLLPCPAIAWARNQARDDAGTLLARLDHPDFQARQMATDSLIALGPPVIEPAALAFSGGSTEQRWRILQVLEAVATRGTESDFFRAAAILRVLGPNRYDSAAIRRLQGIWQSGKSAVALERLRELGATVHTDDESLLGDFRDDPAAFRMAQRAILQFEVVQFPTSIITADDPAVRPAAEPPVSLAADPAQRREQLVGVLAGDTNEHRRLALWDAPSAAPAGPANQGGSELGAPAVRIGGADLDLAFQINGLDVPMAGADGQNRPRSVVFDSHWRGSPDQLASLSAVSNLFLVRFESRPKVTAEELLVLARAPQLRALSLLRSPVGAGAVSAFGELSGLTMIELDLDNVDAGWTESVRQLNGLTHLRLVVGRDGSAKLPPLSQLQSLRSLTLENFRLSAEDFRTVASLPFLTSLSLRCCRFDIPSFRAFQASAPQLELTTTGDAFLGVRSQTILADIEGALWRISEVVAGSAADKAGLQADDMIRSVAGVETPSFRDLTLVISQCRPGERIEIEIQRGQETLKIPVVLGDRKDAPLR